MISRRLALGGLAAAPLLGAAAKKKEIPPPVSIPFRIGENTPWTTVSGGGGEPVPFVLSLISNFLHCDPSVMQGLGAVKDARFGLTGWRVDKVVVGGVLGIDGMPLIPYENYYTQRMVAGTFELNVFPIYEIDWDRRQVTVIYDAQATGDEAYDELEQPHSDTNIFPTLFGKVNGRKVSLLINTVTPGGVVLKGSDAFMAMARGAPRHRENLGRDGEFGGYTFVADSVELGPAKVPNAIVNVAPGPRLPWVGESTGGPRPGSTATSASTWPSA